MAIQAERQLEIMNLIHNNRTVRNDELSKILNVSMNTIRRDLSLLEEKGVLKRTHSGAVLVEAEEYVKSVHVRKNEFVNEKDAIGKLAAKLIDDNDSIIIDAGTTTQHMIKYLTEFYRLTVLTNSLDIADELSLNKKITTILSGGILRETSRSMYGLPAEQFFSQYHANKLFMSVGGISIEENMITNPNIHETETKRKMVQAVDTVILLADHQKLKIKSFCPICKLDLVHKLITGVGAEEAEISALKDMGIEVICAEY